MLTCMDVQHTKHVTYKLAYHFVWCPKYRKKLLVGEIATFVEQELRRICEATTWTIGALNVQEDHVHLFVSTPPSVSPAQIAHTLKGITARGEPSPSTTRRFARLFVRDVACISMIASTTSRMLLIR